MKKFIDNMKDILTYFGGVFSCVILPLIVIVFVWFITTDARAKNTHSVIVYAQSTICNAKFSNQFKRLLEFQKSYNFVWKNKSEESKNIVVKNYVYIVRTMLKREMITFKYCKNANKNIVYYI